LITCATKGGGGLPECRSPPQIKIEKNTDYVDTVISKVSRDLPGNRNQPLNLEIKKKTTFQRNLKYKI